MAPALDRRIFLATIPGALCGLHGAVSAAPIPKERNYVPFFPTTVGAKWVYKNEDTGEELIEFIAEVKPGSSEVVVTVHQGEMNARASLSQRLAVSDKGLFLQLEYRRRFDPPLCLLSLPHEDKSQWKFENSDNSATIGNRTDMKGMMIATGPERIEVPAGVFEAIRVEAIYTLNDKPRKITSWYVPKVGLVKRERKGHISTVLSAFNPRAAAELHEQFDLITNERA